MGVSADDVQLKAVEMNVSPSSLAIRVAVAGGGPAGLLAAIGLFQLGHEVIVLEKLEHPAVRGTVNRDRSYAVDITARGTRALDGVNALHTVEKYMLPFYGHSEWEGPTFGEMPGLIGTRDDLVLGLLEHIKDITTVNNESHGGSIQCLFGVAAGGINLKTKCLIPEDGATELPAAAQGEFDLFVVCDGKNSQIRNSVSKQDNSLVVKPRDGRDGEVLYKTVNFDLIGPDQPKTCDFPTFQAGWLYAIGGPPPVGTICARIPSGSGPPRAIGIVNCDSLNPPPGLEQKLPKGVLDLITPEEKQAFESREVADAGGGFVCSRLCAGGCVAIVGDAATSPAPPGQGSNHALEAAHVLVKAVAVSAAAKGEGLTKQQVVKQAVESYNSQQLPSEQAYAFLGASKSCWQGIVCSLAACLGMHPVPGPGIKASTKLYSELTVLHNFF